MFGLAILFGAFAGFAMGMTGGGGGVFAVPLLVYGLAVAPREAVGISLAAVGGTALFGAAPRWFRGEVEVRTGLLFAVSGMIGAPIGTYVSSFVPESLLLVMFGFLMLLVAWRMWAKATQTNNEFASCQTEDRSACQRDETGQLRLTSRCAMLLAVIGILTGFLTGMFGVGGGFVIVPALVLFSGMEMHRAVGTSLMVIFLVSLSGVTSYLISGRELSIDTTLQFLLGGFVGMWIGGLVAKRMNGKTLQKVFAIGVVLVAMFVITKSVVL